MGLAYLNCTYFIVFRKNHGILMRLTKTEVLNEYKGNAKHVYFRRKSASYVSCIESVFLVKDSLFFIEYQCRIIHRGLFATGTGCLTAINFIHISEIKLNIFLQTISQIDYIHLFKANNNFQKDAG